VLVMELVATSGLYIFYWVYKNWQFVKANERSDIWPAVRTFFYGATIFALFFQIADSQKKAGITPDWNPVVQALLILAISLIADVIVRVAGLQTGPYLLAVSIGIICLVCVFVQGTIRTLYRKVNVPEPRPETGFGRIAITIIGFAATVRYVLVRL